MGHYFIRYYYKCDRNLLQNGSGFILQNATVLLQNATVITNCDDFIIKCNRYNKMQRLLHIATVQHVKNHESQSRMIWINIIKFLILNNLVYREGVIKYGHCKKCSYSTLSLPLYTEYNLNVHKTFGKRSAATFLINVNVFLSETS